jgi:LmbE family N-acetylglucosaminyl deacetylase
MDFTQILDSFQISHLALKSSIPFTVMILSPHPDDESIIGSLPLRLMKENGARVVNVAVTLGSDKKRQKARKLELSHACTALGMELLVLEEDWKKKEIKLKLLIQKYQPSLVLAPHTKDHHPTHIKTGKLFKKILAAPKMPTLLVAWTEFWGQQASPNLMVEVPLEVLELQMKALGLHLGEIERNPYHLRLPAWMMDNVRRGSEIIAGKGACAPNWAFGLIYKLQLAKGGKLSTPRLANSFLDHQTDIAQIFKLILDAASGSKTKVK